MKRTVSLLFALILSIVGCTIPVSAKTGTESGTVEVTVKRKSSLYKEMRKTDAGTIILKLKGNKKLTIGKTGYSDNKKLIINSNKSDITNKAVWKSVEIKKVSSFTERASGNTITVNDPNAKVKIYKKVKVSKLIAPDYHNVTLGKKAKLLEVEYTEVKPTDLDTTGTSTKEENTSFIGKKTDIKKKVTTTSIYTVYEAPSNVVQFKAPDGSFCFAVDGDKEVVIYKTENGEILDKTVRLRKEHSIFGTVTCDEDGYFYLVTGENNEENIYSVNTVFVSKYDSNGKHIITSGFTGQTGEIEDDFNTKYPFDCGCSAAVMNGVITVNYARGMYNGHQSNNVFAKYTSDLSTIRFETFYNSHSFGQRAIAIPEQSTFVFASHGDAAPRADRIGIMRMFKGKMISYDDYQLFHFWGPNRNENNTFACLGGIAKLSYDRLACVGDSAVSMDDKAQNENREIFIQIFNPIKDLYSEDAYYTKGIRRGYREVDEGKLEYTDYGVKWLTSYGKGWFVSNVQLTVTDDDRIVILYELYKSDTAKMDWLDRNNCEYQGVFYMVLDANGEIISDAKLYDKNALLNPFQMPVFADGKIYWVDNRYEIDDKYNDNKKNTDLFLYELSLEPAPENLFSLKDRSDVKKIVAIDKNSFPDDTFRDYVMTFADIDKDMYLDEEEIANVFRIDFGRLQEIYDDDKILIKDLKGIEYFTSLDYLDCSGNLLTELDVSRNTALTYLKCSDNEINTLNLKNDAELNYIDCSRNKLTALDVRNNKALVYLDCHENQLTSLDVSNNTMLDYLRCSENSLTFVDVSKNTELTRFFCSNDSLTKVDVSNNRKLVELNCACSFGVNELDVSNNPLLEVLICYCTSIKKLDVSNNKKLINLNFGITQVSHIDLSNNAYLEFLGCGYTQLVNIDLSPVPLLRVLEVGEDRLSSLDLSKTPLLESLSCERIGLTNLDVSKNPELRFLNASENNLTALDLSKNTKLEELNCRDNPMRELDISKNENLTDKFEHDDSLIVIK